MTKKAIVWIREDIRIENNSTLSYASQNHEIVSALYIYNNNNFDNKREAQKWWLSKSLDSFKKDLNKYNILLEIISGDEIEIFSKFKESNLQIAVSPFSCIILVFCVAVSSDNFIRPSSFPTAWLYKLTCLKGARFFSKQAKCVLFGS